MPTTERYSPGSMFFTERSLCETRPIAAYLRRRRLAFKSTRDEFLDLDRLLILGSVAAWRLHRAYCLNHDQSCPNGLPSIF